MRLGRPLMAQRSYRMSLRSVQRFWTWNMLMEGESDRRTWPLPMHTVQWRYHICRFNDSRYYGNGNRATAQMPWISHTHIYNKSQCSKQYWYKESAITQTLSESLMVLSAWSVILSFDQETLTWKEKLKEFRKMTLTIVHTMKEARTLEDEG
jgi:hypothetical protein